MMFSYKETDISTDLLSNTAQALTSYVEALQDASNTADPLPFLEEALTLFQKCLEYQEIQYREFEEQSAAAAALVAAEIDSDASVVSLTTETTMDIDSPGTSSPIQIWWSAKPSKDQLQRPSLELWYLLFSADPRLNSYPFHRPRPSLEYPFLAIRSRGRALVGALHPL